MANQKTKRLNYVALKERYTEDKIGEYLQAIKELAHQADFTLGPKLAEFEKAFSQYLGSQYTVGVVNGTEGLRLSLIALGVGVGDEVITTPLSFIATANAIDLIGAKPVFVDTGPDLLLDPEKIEASITPKTRAIMPVHWAGNIADMPKICEIAKKHNLKVIEDAAMGVGSSIDGKSAGTWGDMAEFSFHPNKNFCVWGDGGAITTQSAELAEKIIRLRNHGQINRNDIVYPGYNSRLAPIQAVVALVELKKVDAINAKRIANAMLLYELLSGVEGVTLLPIKKNSSPNLNQFMVLVERREELISYLDQNGVEALVHYPIPMHLQIYYRAKYSTKEGDCPNAEYQAKHVLSLPNNEYLDYKDMEYIASLVKKFYKN